VLAGECDLSATLLVCDDEELIRWSLATHFTGRGFRVVQASDGAEALERVASHAPDLVLLDLNMPNMGGLQALRELRKQGSEVPVVVLTAHGGVDSAIEATQLGASGYLAKPFDLREVELTIDNVLEAHRLKTEVRTLRRQLSQGYGGFLGAAPSLKPLFDVLRRLERVSAPTVLITGASGSGKDVIARELHKHGPRATRPFVAIDCASLPPTLIESALFGHERGAFTDAKQRKPGLFETAEGGTAFLDEIGELPHQTQSTLLRALEDRTFMRVGGTQRMKLDVSIVAATNRDLKREVAAGRFREDLLFRLDVIHLHVPPLRDRKGDVELLAQSFLDRFARANDRRPPAITGEALELLANHQWPGNVRELRNAMERLTLLGPEDVIRAADLPAEIRFGGAHDAGDCPYELPEEGIDLQAVELGLLRQALARTGGNQSAAARLLGLSRYQLRYRAEKCRLL